MKSKIIKSLAAMLTIGAPIVSCAGIESAAKPSLKENILKFANGKQVVFPHERSEKIHSESFKLLVDAEDEVAVVVHQQKLYEDSAISVFAYSFDGRSLYSVDSIFGSIHLLKDRNLLIITRYSAHYVQNESEIFDYSGKTVHMLEPPAAVSFGGLSEDKKYVWLAAEIFEMPISYEVFIYDLEGKKVAYGTSVPKGNNFHINEEIYQWDLTGLRKLD